LVAGKALQEMHAKGIEGREVTPFLLQRVNELMGGHSLAANTALIQNNAKHGALIAVELDCFERNATCAPPHSPYRNSVDHPPTRWAARLRVWGGWPASGA